MARESGVGHHREPMTAYSIALQLQRAGGLCMDTADSCCHRASESEELLGVSRHAVPRVDSRAPAA